MVLKLVLLVEEEAAAAAALVASKRLKGKSYREKADAEENGKVKAEKPRKDAPLKVEEESAKSSQKSEEGPKAKGPKGLIMEVVIPRHTMASSAKSDRSSVRSSPTDEDQISDAEEGPTRKRKRRAAALKTDLSVMDDSDDEGLVSAAPSKTSSAKSSKASVSAPKRRRLIKRGSPTSDYQGSSSEDEDESPSDASMSSGFEESEDEDDNPKPKKKGKGKAKAIAKPKPKAKANGGKSATETEDTEAESAMDVDSEPSEKAAKKKTVKCKDAAEKVAKKSKPTDSDPWKLGGRAVQSDWTCMQAPPLEMFHFARVVVDEYTYLDGKVHALVTNLTAERQWVLSGTPPIHDFGALKTIAAFLDIHLGVDDDGEGRSAEVKKRKREQTGKSDCKCVSCRVLRLAF